MAKFSTDRTICEYAQKIWKIDQVDIKNELVKWY